MTSAEVLGIVASVVFVARLLPQPIRLARTGRPAGVSPLAALNQAITTAAWLAYGFGAHLPIVWGVSVIALVPGVWTVALLWRETTRRDLAAAGAWVAVAVVAAAFGWLAAVLALGVVVTQGPQVLKACVDDDLSGIAPATWWLALADAATWGAYGVAVGDVALMAYAVVLSSSAAIVLVRIQFTRSRRRALAPA